MYAINRVSLLPSPKMLFIAVFITGLSSSSLYSERPKPIGERRYELVDLGTLGGQSSGAMAVDELGNVVGWSLTATGERRAFIWRDGSDMQDLGTLQNGGYSSAVATSDNGKWVAGNSGIRPALNPEQYRDINQGFVWSDGVMQSIGALSNPGTPGRRFGTSEAHAVNDHGQIAGFSNVLRQNLQSAVLWENGVLTDIGRATDTVANTRAFGINNSGQVVGDIILSGGVGSGNPEAFLWEDNEFQQLGNPPGATQSIALAINDNGQIVGWGGNGSQMFAALWSSGTVEDLGTLPGDESSQALDVNALGQVVGWSGTSEQTRAFFWESGAMTDLDSLLPPNSGWTLTEATNLNNRGMIVGSGRKNGEVRAFMLKPGSAPPEHPSRRFSCVPSRYLGATPR